LRQQLPDALPVDQRHRQDRAGLDADVEQIRARAQPELLRNQQMAGRGDRQEFGDAFDDAEQDDAEQIDHG
jgi:hypothetical protein